MTDTQLIDWLEEHAKKSRTGISFDWIRACEGEPSGFRFMRRHHIGDPCPSIRKTIEQAMESEAKGEFR
jgi:hypothetical protein